MAAAVGGDLADELRDSEPGRLPPGGRATRAARGIILADTKFEWGRLPDGSVILIDEVLTPDSSRFWPADGYRAGRGAAVVRQAVRPRLAGGERLGQEQPAAAAAGRGRRADAGAIPGGVERLTGHGLPS